MSAFRDVDTLYLRTAMRFINAIIFHPVVSHRHSHTHPVYIHIPPSLLQFYPSLRSSLPPSSSPTVRPLLHG